MCITFQTVTLAKEECLHTAVAYVRTEHRMFYYVPSNF
jgi:hypothetical protein